jgi:hypothetical protein
VAEEPKLLRLLFKQSLGKPQRRRGRSLGQRPAQLIGDCVDERPANTDHLSAARRHALLLGGIGFVGQASESLVQDGNERLRIVDQLGQRLAQRARLGQALGDERLCTSRGAPIAVACGGAACQCGRAAPGAAARLSLALRRQGSEPAGHGP